ncbi:MAG: GNAT family N-acetyltransferase [Stackebrandtia sp.]
MSVRVEPATADRWDDLVAAFGKRGADPGWCWCRLFLRRPGTAATQDRPDNREALRQEMHSAAVPPGLIAYADGVPVGWTRTGPRSGFPGVTGNRALAKVLIDDPGTWWVTCFAVGSRHRRTGVGAALLTAAVVFAGDHGATAVEGHPVDTAALTAARVSGAAVYTGTMSMFVTAGFVEVARTYRTRPVMRLEL